MLQGIENDVIHIKNYKGQADRLDVWLEIKDKVEDSESQDGFVCGKRFFCIREGKNEYKVDFEELLSIIFLMGKDDEQQKMVPIKTGRVRHLNSAIRVRAKKDIAKGEEIVVFHTYKVPEEMFTITNDKGILIPK